MTWPTWTRNGSRYYVFQTVSFVFLLFNLLSVFTSSFFPATGFISLAKHTEHTYKSIVVRV
jgi:hypothetical protein